MITTDPYGTLHPEYNSSAPRFTLYVDRHDPDDEPGWRYKLRLVDHKYSDSDGFPIDSIAAGDSWVEAFARAGKFVTQALASDECIF